MTTLVVGASGATGKQLVEQLLNMEQKVKVIVRPTGKIPEAWKNNQNINNKSQYLGDKYGRNDKLFE